MAGALNGKPVVRFDASKSQCLNLPNFLSSAAGGEVIVVLKNSAPAGSSNGLMRFGASDDWYPNGAGNLYGSFGSTGAYLEGVPAPPLNQFNVYEQSSQAGLWQSWMNGVPFFSSSTNTVAFSTAPLLGQTNYGSYFTGDIAEVLVYSRALTDAERASVRAYLTQKYLLAPAPAAPVVAAFRISATQNCVNWNAAPTGAPIDYVVQRANGAGGTYSTLATVNTGGTYLDGTVVEGQTYYYQVYAQNAAGQSATSAAVTPLRYKDDVSSLPTGLQLWLMGDGAWESPLSNWHDYSGQGHDAFQPAGPQQPAVVAGALNGKPVVRFDASKSQCLQLPDFISSATAGEVVVVLRSAVAATGVNNGLMRFGGSDDWYPNGAGNLYGSFGSTGAYLEGVPAPPLNQFNVYEQSSQAGRWQSWMNGVPFFSSSTNTVAFSTAPLLGQTNYGSYFTGDIAEVLVYSRALTDAERTAVGVYLAKKYLILDMDPDHDGLTTRQELALGTDPLNPDTNGDGLLDGPEYFSGLSPTNLDMDGDGISNAQEILNGTNPFSADTDHDGVPDNLDYYPLDPTRSQAPAPTAGVPVLTLSFPPGATLQP